MDVNIWGLLGCALTYAAALFAAVDAIGDHMIQRSAATRDDARSGLRLKTGSKISAAAIGVITAAIVLWLDGNWPALVLLTLAFVAVVLWVVFVYRQGSRVQQKS